MEQTQYKRITLKAPIALYRALKKLGANNDWTVPVQARRTLEQALAQNIETETDYLLDEAQFCPKTVSAASEADTEVLATAEELLIARGHTGQSL